MVARESKKDLITTYASTAMAVRDGGVATPALIASAGDAARFAWEEFIYGSIRNAYTRRNYTHAITQFLAWCDGQHIRLAHIAPRDVGQYLDGLRYEPATKKVHLAALRHCFDQLVRRHVLVLNPAASVRSDRLQMVEGRTPEISVVQTRRLLASIDTSRLVGLRDRAIIATLIYTAARVGAVARLRRGDFYDLGDQKYLRLTEKGTKLRELPVRHDLGIMIGAYLDASGIRWADKTAPLFRTALGRTNSLTKNAMSASDIACMVKRRLRDIELSERFSPHSFRVAVITDLLNQGVSLQDVQTLAGHADPRTTRLYDRRHRQVTRNIVERIGI